MTMIYHEAESVSVQPPTATSRQYRRPAERPFHRNKRVHTQVLFGGLTWKHERLIQASACSLGYQFKALPTPTVSAFQIGKEYGNNGQCNPTYFTVGNLVEYLKGLESQGMSRETICEKYVFLTAGACGPCRFGMYEAEYRLALENAGFGDFRVILFQQKGGLKQSDIEAGIETNAAFLLGLLNAFVLGDLLNELAYQIRPYEQNEGDTDQVLRTSVEKVADYLECADLNEVNDYQLWFYYLSNRSILKVLASCYQAFRAIPIDPLRVKPVVKVTGEFWAQTTEGDGNYGMFSFLESEQSEVLVEPIGTWITYMLHQTKQKIRDRQTKKSIRTCLKQQSSLLKLTLAEKLFERHWNRCRRALGNAPHALLNQYHLQQLGHTYYNSRAQGGEGHLEVAKNIYYCQNKKAHMVLSLKPFGCMPSTQSDGVQSAVVNAFPEMIFLPVETSGEGEVNAKSRVQMSLAEAKEKAFAEYQAVEAQCKHTHEEIRKYLSVHPEQAHVAMNSRCNTDICGSAAKALRYLDRAMV